MVMNGSLKARIEAECQYPTLGKKVRVVRGRSDKGFEGELFWMREYAGYGYKTYIRVGVRNDIGDVAWVYHRNVDVVDPETISDEMIEHYLKNLADNGAFRNPSMMTNLLKGRALNNPVIA